MSYTVEQVAAAVQDTSADDYSDDVRLGGGVYTRPYQEGHFWYNNDKGFVEHASMDWNDFEDTGFIVIDGEQVDYKVVSTTGGMDEGSHASITFQIGDQYFRKSGYYASHYGYDWDGELEEVRPVQKVVTVFE